VTGRIGQPDGAGFDVGSGVGAGVGSGVNNTDEEADGVGAGSGVSVSVAAATARAVGVASLDVTAAALQPASSTTTALMIRVRFKSAPGLGDRRPSANVGGRMRVRTSDAVGRSLLRPGFPVLVGAGYGAWRTRARQAASPNSMAIKK
jgi:hypothetical protein